MKKISLMLTVLLVSGFCYAQNILTGTITDAELGRPLPGATVIVKGTTNGVSTSFDGTFTISASEAGALVVSYIGYDTQEVAFSNSMTVNVAMQASSNELDGITVFGTVDFAIDRETPVAVSTLTAADIQERIGNLELPEMLNSTPGVYATRAGGAFGDSRINVRGFDSQNTAVLINGIPVNDMENGRVYWSNWSGLADVVSAMQVQRGLGASKLAISSVGGTINVLTKSTDLTKGGKIATSIGNDGYMKTVLGYNTGEMEGGHALSFLMSRTAGDGYVDGTMFEGYNYFLGYGWKSDRHNVQVIVTGAPQTHNQRTGSYYNMAKGEQYKQYGIRYNYNHGYLNGQEFSWRKNFYHKPIASVNWEFNINDSTELSASAYYSIGRGGGTGDIGRAYGFQYASGDLNYNGKHAFRNPINGHFNYDKLAAYNGGVATTFYNGRTAANSIDAATGLYIVNDPDERVGGVKRNGIVRRASVNSHNFVGSLINLKKTLSDNLNLDFGVDLRSYKGIHYRRLDNLLGADGYRDFDNKNYAGGSAVRTKTYISMLGKQWNVFKDTDDEEKIDYHNDGLVRWTGVFTQLEYKVEKLSAFVQGAISNQGFQRVEYFNQVGTATTDWENITGGNVKLGANYNINAKSNVYVNSGMYSKQPNFDAVYINYGNNLNPDLKNETVTGLEAGYGYRSNNLTLNVNIYRTTWDDRFLSNDEVEYIDSSGNEEEGIANYYGIQQLHKGIEIDGTYKLSPFVKVEGMISLGNWKYTSDVTVDVFDSARNKVSSSTIFLDGVKVGDAAQTTSRINLVVNPTDLFKFNVSMFSASQLYANFNPEEFDTDGDMAMKIPSYELFDFGSSYNLSIAGEKVYVRLNVNNIFDNHYIAESSDNIVANPGDPTYLGVHTKNKVFPGWGRTWNLGFSYRF